MRVPVAKVTDTHVYFTVPDPAPEVIVLDGPYGAGFKGSIAPGSIPYGAGFKGSIAPGSIPYGVKQIEAATIDLACLEPKAIPDSVTHLHLYDLNAQTVIPASVKHLFVLNFKADSIAFVPDTVTHLYVHVCDRGLAPVDQVHYLFARASVPGWISSKYPQDPKYRYREEYQEFFFDSCFAVVKRTPKAVVPAPTEPCVLVVGKTYTDLVISDAITDTLIVPNAYAGPIRPGSIPERITKLDLTNCSINELEPRAIGETVTHLFLRTLTEKLAVPPSITHLVVWYFQSPMIKYVPSTVTHLYIHTGDSKYAPQDRVHYLFHPSNISDSNLTRFETEKLDVSLELNKPFENMGAVFKREPKKPIANDCSGIILAEITKLNARIDSLVTAVEELAK